MPTKTPVQKAIVALRKRLGDITQQDLAVRMGKTVGTIARWETSYPPSGWTLLELERFALEAGCPDVALVFAQARSDEPRMVHIPMTIDERLFHDGVMDVLRNERTEKMRAHRLKILDAIISGLSDLVAAGHAGKRIVGASLEEVEYTLESLKTIRRVEFQNKS